jgi:hypothetical protein
MENKDVGGNDFMEVPTIEEMDIVTAKPEPNLNHQEPAAPSATSWTNMLQRARAYIEGSPVGSIAIDQLAQALNVFLPPTASPSTFPTAVATPVPPPAVLSSPTSTPAALPFSTPVPPSTVLAAPSVPPVAAPHLSAGFLPQLPQQTGALGYRNTRVVDLKVILRQRGLSTSGLKAQLVDRLVADDAKKAASASSGRTTLTHPTVRVPCPVSFPPPPQPTKIK